MASAKSKADILKRYLSSSTSESNGRWDRGRLGKGGRRGIGEVGGCWEVQLEYAIPTQPHNMHHLHYRGHEDEEEAQEAAGGRDGRHAYGGPGRVGRGGSGRQR